MILRHLNSALLACVLVLGGCASVPPGAGVAGNGVVQSIAESTQGSTAGNVVGAVGGAVLGGWLGSGIGGGTGQTIATTVGAVGGGMAGSALGSKATEHAVWDVVVRFEDGIDRTIRVTERPTFRPGDRVTVSNGIVTPRR
jgi:outer membrane lipoprotein SlyB